MGMSGEVIAIGPFRRALVPYLRHDERQHAQTREGSVIVERVFETPEGNERSRALAACFGVDPWDFASHELDASSADVQALRELFREELPTTRPDPVEKWLRLRDAGFRFFFRPRG
ncbi:hypothetical protein L6R52_06010 [Myxococcota bacterium]|nr:hypothetical protein [Myxococcota bacterium]